MHFNFRTMWDSDYPYVEKATILVKALVATGNFTEDEAVAFITEFQHNSFDDGCAYEAANNDYDT